MQGKYKDNDDSIRRITDTEKSFRRKLKRKRVGLTGMKNAASKHSSHGVLYHPRYCIDLSQTLMIGTRRFEKDHVARISSRIPFAVRSRKSSSDCHLAWTFSPLACYKIRQRSWVWSDPAPVRFIQPLLVCVKQLKADSLFMISELPCYKYIGAFSS